MSAERLLPGLLAQAREALALAQRCLGEFGLGGRNSPGAEEDLRLHVDDALAAIDAYKPEPLPEVVGRVADALSAAATLMGDQRLTFLSGDIGEASLDAACLRAFADNLRSAVPAPPPAPKPSWLLPWEELSEPEGEVDRRIGERIVRLAWADWNRVASPAVQPAADPLAHLRSLAPGWDSYSAHAPTAQALATAEAMLAPPHVVPTVRGGVQLEWPAVEVEVEIAPSGLLAEDEASAVQPPAEGPCSRALRNLYAAIAAAGAASGASPMSRTVQLALAAAEIALAGQPEPENRQQRYDQLRGLLTQLAPERDGNEDAAQTLARLLRERREALAASVGEKLVAGVDAGVVREVAGELRDAATEAHEWERRVACPSLERRSSAWAEDLASRLDAALGGAGEATPPVDVSALLPIAEAMRLPDDHGTAHPMFIVEERERVYGVGSDYTETWAYVDEEGIAHDEYDEGLRRVGYLDRWRHFTTCFSRAAAEQFIQREKHNLIEPRVRVASAYRNAEWQTVRGFLLGLGRRVAPDALSRTPDPPGQAVQPPQVGPGDQGVWFGATIGDEEGASADEPLIADQVSRCGCGALATVFEDGAPGTCDRCHAESEHKIAEVMAFSVSGSAPTCYAHGLPREDCGCPPDDPERAAELRAKHDPRCGDLSREARKTAARECPRCNEICGWCAKHREPLPPSPAEVALYEQERALADRRHRDLVELAAAALPVTMQATCAANGHTYDPVAAAVYAVEQAQQAIAAIERA